MTINRSCIVCDNLTCLIKKHCSDDDILNDIDQNKDINLYRNRQFIFQEGDFTKNVFFILSGKVKVFLMGANEKNQIVRFSKRGDILGHRGFIPSGVYPVSAQAIFDSEICYLPKKYFFNLLDKVPELTINLMLSFANELFQEETKLRNMSVFNVREKVAVALITIVKSFGLDENQNIVDIDLLSRQDIAELVGLKANQVTKVLSDLKVDGIIEIVKNKIKITSYGALEKIVSY